MKCTYGPNVKITDTSRKTSITVSPTYQIEICYWDISAARIN